MNPKYLPPGAAEKHDTYTCFQPRGSARMGATATSAIPMTAITSYPNNALLEQNIDAPNLPFQDCQGTFWLPLEGERVSTRTQTCFDDDSPLRKGVYETLARHRLHQNPYSKNMGLSRPHYIDKRLATIILICSLVTPVAAISGDDWANNLFSDLAPILALFGEQVAKQFLSDSSGVADSILFAMAPLGVITAIVSAIRVAGHPWLKALVGRGKEGLAQAELELMSSNSQDVGEMYNGEAIVRVLGTPTVFQFFYAAEDRKPGNRTEKSPLPPPARNLITSLTKRFPFKHPRLVSRHDTSARGLEMRAYAPPPPNATGQLISSSFARSAAASCSEKTFVQKVGILDEQNHFFEPAKKRVPMVTTTNPEPANPDLEERWNDNYDIEISLLQPTESDQIIQDQTNENKNPPNMSINARGKPIGNLEKILMASIAVVVQLAVLIFGGFISYHPSVKGQFRKNDSDPSKEAFPCTAVGTVALNFGMFICSYVIDRVTTEETWVLKKDLSAEDIQKCSVCWIQKGGTVSDQVFAPYLIFGDKSQKKIRTSHRCHRNPKVEVELHFLVLLGTTMSVVGFVTQFVGLRGMNWSAPIAQLGATAFVTAIRSIIRRRMTREPNAIKAVEGYELDCMARRITHCSGWKVIPEVPENGKLDVQPDDLCYNTLAVRKRLSSLSHWESDTEDLSSILCSAMEKTINFLYRSKEIVWIGSESTGCSLKWHLPVIARDAPDGTGTSLEAAAAGSGESEATATVHYANLPFNLSRQDRRGNWKVDEGANADLASILSLWKLRFAEEETHHRTKDIVPERKDLNDTHPAVKVLSWPRHAGDRELFNMWMGSHDLDIRPSSFEYFNQSETIPIHRFVGRLGTKRCPIGEDPSIVIFPAASMKRLFAQEIFSIYLSAISSHIRDILGPVERIPHENRIDIAEFRHSALSQLVETISQTGLGTHQEIHLMIVTALGAREILPLGDNAAEIDIMDMEHIRLERPLKQLALRNEWGLYAAEIIRLTQSVEMNKTPPSIQEMYVMGFVKQFWIRILFTLDKNHVDRPQPYSYAYERLISTEFQPLIPNNYRNNNPDPVVNNSNDLPSRGLNELECFFLKRMPHFKEWWLGMKDYFQRNRNDASFPEDSPQLDHRAILESPAGESPHYILEVEALTAQVVREPVSAITLDNLLAPAASGGHYQILESLLHHIYTRFPNYYRQMQLEHTQIPILLFKAVLSGRPTVVQLLLKQIRKHEVAGYRQAAFIYAANKGHPDVALALLADGASINSRVVGRYDQSLLMPCSTTSSDAKEYIEISPGYLRSLRNMYFKFDAGFFLHGDHTALLLSGGRRFQNHHEAVVSYLLANCNPRKATAAISSRTALEAAAAGGQLEMVEKLCGEGAEADSAPVGRIWSSALQYAAGHGNHRLVPLLKHEGADINQRAYGCFGRTALQAAAGGGHSAASEHLLDLGADPNSPPASFGGRTALQAAAEGKDWGLAAILLEYGADVLARPAPVFGLTAIQAAAGSWAGNTSLLTNLIKLYVRSLPGSLCEPDDATATTTPIDNKVLELFAVNEAPSAVSGRTALQAASQLGELQAVDHLLLLGAEVNAPPSKRLGLTALQAAALGGHVSVVNKLLDAGAEVDACPARREGLTALQAAASIGHLEIVNLLVKSGASVVGTNGATALECAANGGHTEVFCRLITAGAISEANNNQLRRATTAAARNGHLGIIQYLKQSSDIDNCTIMLEYDEPNAVSGAWSSSSKDDESTIPLIAAAEGGHLEIVDYLGLLAPNTPGTPYWAPALRAASFNGHLKVVDTLLNPKWGSLTGEHVGAALVGAMAGGHMHIVTELFRCCATQYIDEIPNNYIRQAFQEAAGHGQLKMVILFLCLGAQVNDVTDEHQGRTALHAAAASGHLLVVEHLLAAGANVNDDSGKVRGFTVLQEAARSGHLAVVERLLAAGANVNAAPGEQDGRTALQAAAESGHLLVIKRLLAAGADVNAVASEYYGRAGASSADVNTSAANNSRRPGRTALLSAMASGHLPVVECLIAAGADVNAEPPHDNGRTALQAAAGSGDLPLVERLLKAGANVKAGPAEQHGRTALQAAAESGHLAVVKRLLDAGADVNEEPAEEDGRTALQAAAESGHLAVLGHLITAGAKVNADPAEQDGRTALQAAAEYGHLPVVGRLIAASADVNADPAEQDGRTALQAAAESGHLSVLVHLLKAGAKVDGNSGNTRGFTALQAAARSGHLKVVGFLLGAGANVNADPTKQDGRTALQAAAESGHLAVIEHLITAGANVNADPAEQDGRTALQAAAESGHLTVVKRLLDAGANVNAIPGRLDGRTALQAAAGSGHLQVVRHLLEAHANVNAAPAHDRIGAALKAAVASGHLLVFDCLLAAGAEVTEDLIHSASSPDMVSRVHAAVGAVEDFAACASGKGKGKGKAKSYTTLSSNTKSHTKSPWGSIDD